MLLNPMLARAVARRTAAPLSRLPNAVAASPSLRTARWYASSVDPDNVYDSLEPLQLPEGFEKLGTSPRAMSAISKLLKVMSDNGMDLHSGEKPTMWQMIKLARNEDVRAATSEVMKELKDAGVDVSPERLQAIMKSQDLFGKGSDGDK